MTSVEWFDLRKRAQMQLHRAEASQVPYGDWDNLLMRFRKLREALTAAAAPADLRREVYEVSADVCAAADNMAELLKCLQQLVNNIYPALERTQQQQPQLQQLNSHQQPCQQERHGVAPQPQQQQHQQQQQQQQHGQQHLTATQANNLSSMATNRAHNSSSSRYRSAWSDRSSDEEGDNGAIPTSSSSSSRSKGPLQRYPEVAAALLLYFVCIPRQPVIQEVTKQLRAAGRTRTGQQEPLIAHPVYRQAVLDTAAALRCNWCHFLSSFCGQPQPSLLVRAVMAQHVERMRLQAVRRVGFSYRMLPTVAFQRWLHLQQQKQQQHLSTSSSRESTLAVGEVGSHDAQHIEFQRVVGLLQQAGEGGSKAASIAAAKCLEEGSLPATLHFRA